MGWNCSQVPAHTHQGGNFRFQVFVAKYCKSDACLIVQEAPESHSLLELLKFQLLAGGGGAYRPVYERWSTPTGRLMTFITSCPHTRAPAPPPAKPSVSAYQMSVTVFLLLDFCSGPGSTLIPGTDCNSPCYGFAPIPPLLNVKTLSGLFEILRLCILGRFLFVC